MEHGSLEYVGGVADDVMPGKLTSFPQSVKLKRGGGCRKTWIKQTGRQR
jgi:uncharacterized protein YbaA (DUF1428 family)